MHKAFGLLLTVPVLLAGCDSAVLSSLGSQGDARSGMQALLSALDGGAPTSALTRDDAPSRIDFRSSEAGELVSVSVPCIDGGSMQFEGDLDISNVDGDVDFDPDDPTSLPDGDIGSLIPTIDFSYAVTLDGCTAQGVVIDGTLTYEMHTGWNDASSQVDVSWDYGGEVDFSGTVVGNCAFDFGGAASAGVDADFGELDPSDFDGDVCGYEASEALGEIDGGQPQDEDEDA